MGPNIKHGRELLQQIAAGIAREPRARVATLVVIFRVGDNAYTFGLAEALDILANDLYWDDRGNWSDARIAEVTCL